MGPEAGQILMAGGDKGGTLGPFFLATSTNSSASAQIYNPASGTLGALSLTTSPLNTARESATSVVLPNGLTLIVGGEDCVPDTYFSAVGFLCTALHTAELYSESTGSFTYAGSGSGGLMTSARSGPSATLIEGSGTALDGQVLIVGGSSGQSFLSTGTPTQAAPSQIALNTAELYNPATDAFTAIASVPGCPAGESSISTPTACTTGLPASCPGTATVITSASETGTTVTINSAANPAGLIVGDYVTIANVSVGGTVGAAGYNGTFPVTAFNNSSSPQTITYTAAVSGLGAGTGGSAAADTTQCGMVDQGAALIPNSGGQVLLAGGDLITFLGESSTMTFLFTPSTQAFTLATGALNTPRELFELLPMDPKVVTGALSGDLVAFGGIEANSAVCTNGDIVATTLNTAEVYNPSTQTWSAAANTMGAKRAGLGTLFETGSLAGQVILPGGVDVEASTVTGSLTTANCVFTTSGLKQAAESETDLYAPDTGTGGTFTATGSLEQAREGPVQAQLTTGDNEGDVIVIGGACTKVSPNLSSWVIGTSTAGEITTCGSSKATTDYSELYSQTGGTWSLGPGALSSGADAANSAASAILP